MGKIDPEDIVGNQYGKVTIVKHLGVRPRSEGSKKKDHFYLCQCSCGNTAEASRGQILRGKRKSCGDCRYIEREDDHYRYYDINGRSFIFDGQDMELVLSRKWHVGSSGYVWGEDIENGKRSTFSRILLGVAGRGCADHINGDRCDNRRANLRICSNSQNHANQCLSSRNTTGYKGVSLTSDGKKYRAYLTQNKNTINLGRFNTSREAALAYDRAARLYFGEFACLNFPEEGEQGCQREFDRVDKAWRCDAIEDFEDLDAVI